MMKQMENKGVNNNRLLAILGLVVVAVATRFMPHPPNATAIGAVALFSGAYLLKNRLAFLVPLVAMFISDLFIGLHWGVPFVYAAFILIALIGNYISKRAGVLNILGASLASSIIFFIISNFGTWAQGFYPMTWTGLVECYTFAIPFFRNTLVGDLVFNTALFGGFYLLQMYVPQLRAEKA